MSVAKRHFSRDGPTGKSSEVFNLSTLIRAYSRGLRFFLLPGFPHCFRGLMTFGQGWKTRALLGASHGFPLAFNRRRRAGFGR